MHIGLTKSRLRQLKLKILPAKQRTTNQEIQISFLNIETYKKQFLIKLNIEESFESTSDTILVNTNL